MKKIFPILSLVFVFIIIGIMFYADKISGKGNPDIENISLEDALIVNDIKMNIDEDKNIPENFDGNIIYDNNFDDTIIDYDKIVTKENKDSSNTIDELKKKNSRWHVTKYRIKKHDNLWVISKKFDVSHKLIIKINNIQNPGRLNPGKYIDVPNRIGVYHIIKKGDSISKIAKKYKVRNEKIISHNGLAEKTLIIGKKIFIPDAKNIKMIKSENKSNSKYAKSTLRIIWPMHGMITSGFGTRKDPFSGQKRFHCGIDISAVTGTPVKAASQGRVIFSGWKPGYGNIVILKHRDGYITVYAHTWKNLVKVNQTVKQGKLVAYSGNTGETTGAHLHFELRKFVTPLDPMRFMR